MKVRRIRYYALLTEDEEVLHLRFMQKGFIIVVPKTAVISHNRLMRAIDASVDIMSKITEALGEDDKQV